MSRHEADAKGWIYGLLTKVLKFPKVATTFCLLFML